MTVANDLFGQATENMKKKKNYFLSMNNSISNIGSLT